SDPRTLFGLLNPSARFKVIGHKSIGGERLTELRATTPPRTRALSAIPDTDPGAKVKSMTVWVDGHQVVRQMWLGTEHASSSVPLYLKKFKNGSLEVVVPSKAYLKVAKAMAQKLRRLYHVTVGIDPKVSGKIAHHDLVSTVSVTFSGFGQPQVIPV